ncbi:hypothetical protein TNIN_213171 [Trichonephila inaurata madagascariensis]|uniref:Uncharacterized protein n=1 Tax=Trichonephila inaurata madagascariensis TaxID=2747483 RepID=A0A8X6WMF1_9ARAC|nr:hypothetical protein TNIN_213171 [Trichonephila inaurata madagascariensis]
MLIVEVLSFILIQKVLARSYSKLQMALIEVVNEGFPNPSTQTKDMGKFLGGCVHETGGDITDGNDLRPSGEKDQLVNGKGVKPSEGGKGPNRSIWTCFRKGWSKKVDWAPRYASELCIVGMECSIVSFEMSFNMDGQNKRSWGFGTNTWMGGDYGRRNILKRFLAQRGQTFFY